MQSAVPGTPAANAGLTEDDTIISVGGQSITSSSSLVAVKDRYHPGDKVQVVWLDPDERPPQRDDHARDGHAGLTPSRRAPAGAPRRGSPAQAPTPATLISGSPASVRRI